MYSEAELAFLKKLGALIRKNQTKRKTKIFLKLRHDFPVKKLKNWLELVAIPKSSFYDWKAKLNQPEEDTEENTLIEAIIEVSSQSDGYRRVTLALNQRGRKINHKRS